MPRYNPDSVDSIHYLFDKEGDYLRGEGFTDPIPVSCDDVVPRPLNRPVQVYGARAVGAHGEPLGDQLIPYEVIAEE